MERSSDSANDILDLIDEICRLREIASLPLPPIPNASTLSREMLHSLPQSI